MSPARIDGLGRGTTVQMGLAANISGVQALAIFQASLATMEKDRLVCHQLQSYRLEE